MPKLFNSLEEIPHTHLVTLRHAAEISPYIRSCTLGLQNESALKEETLEDVLEKRSEEEEDLPKAVFSPASSNTKRLSNGDHIFSMQSLDFNTIKAIVLFREAEQQRVKTARKELISLATTSNCSIEAIRERRSGELEISIGADSQLKHRCSDVELESKAEATSVKQCVECDRQLDTLRKQTHRKLQVIAFEAISQYQQQFRGKYEIVANLLVSIDKQTLLACADYNSQLKELIQLFDQMISRIKAGDCGPAELTTAENLCRSLDTLESSIIGELENIVKHEHQKANEYKAAAAAEAEVAAEAVQQEHQRQSDLQQQQQQQQQHQQQQQQQHQQQHQQLQHQQLQQQQLQQQQLQQQQLQQQQLQQQQLQQQQLQQQQLQQQQLQQQQQQQLQQQEHQRQSELQQQQEAITVAAPPTPVAAAPTMKENSKQRTSEPGDQFATAERVQFFTQINVIYAEKEANAKTLQADEANKRYSIACKIAITQLVNKIDAHSPQRLQDRFDNLYGFFCGQTLNTNYGPVSINDHPLSRDFCLLVMAGQFIKQAACNQLTLYAVASIVVSLWKLMPDFGPTFLACIFKESPLLVPFIPHRRPGQSTDEFMQVMGFQFDANQKPETFENFLTRLSGIARLYSTVMVSNGRQADAALPHPFGLDQAWRWLTNLIALQTLPDVNATVLLQFLECASADMLVAYGRQYIKILCYIRQQYCPRMRASDEQRGMYERIEHLLSQFLDKGQLPKQTGRLAPNFW